MKRTYITPAIRTVDLETEQLLSGSNSPYQQSLDGVPEEDDVEFE